ncbi:putative ABC transporter permease [uncultured Ruminococcus sp.]|uniref:putative ABC transporter permease n=1 Tax=uncultured Ruminococcus sp. TaxID=165186 RepID=UPI00260BC1EE|nr:putative ABC transporter permease [uncultured Ruminococcus sp.]
MAKIKELFEKQTVQKLFLCFWMYALLGWIYEVFLEVVVYRWGFHNRGELFGPYLPIYGVGAMLFLLCFSRLMKKKDVKWLNIVKPFLIFLGCMAVATAVELAASYILEYTSGSWPWQTYARYKYNFQARIALSTSIRFGLGGLLFMYIVQPFYNWLLSKPTKKTINIIAVIVLVIVVTDFILTNALGYTPKLAQ